MFHLVVNNFAEKGFCSYRDEDKNLARFQRGEKEDNFTARLRFERGVAIVEPLVVAIGGDSEAAGGELKGYPAIGYTLDSEEIQRPIQGFAVLVQRWYAMLNAIKRMPGKGTADATVWHEIITALSKYEELQPALNGLV